VTIAMLRLGSDKLSDSREALVEDTGAASAPAASDVVVLDVTSVPVSTSEYEEQKSRDSGRLTASPVTNNNSASNNNIRVADDVVQLTRPAVSETTAVTSAVRTVCCNC